MPGAPVTDDQAAEYASLFWEYVAEDRSFTVSAEYATQLTRRALFDRDSFGEVLRYTTVPAPFSTADCSWLVSPNGGL